MLPPGYYWITFEEAPQDIQPAEWDGQGHWSVLGYESILPPSEVVLVSETPIAFDPKQFPPVPRSVPVKAQP